MFESDVATFQSCMHNSNIIFREEYSEDTENIVSRKRILC